jgi:hypothetical protein
MLIMRNEPHGMIWQAYNVVNETERTILTSNANKNGFIVQHEPLGYTEESSPGWQETQSWKDCLMKYNIAMNLDRFQPPTPAEQKPYILCTECANANEAIVFRGARAFCERCEDEYQTQRYEVEQEARLDAERDAKAERESNESKLLLDSNNTEVR